MKVTIRTKNGAVLSPFERKAIRHAAQFYAQTLMSNRITENLDVKINVINGYFKNHKIVADVTPMDDDVNYRQIGRAHV